MFSVLKKAAACAVSCVMFFTLSACGNKEAEEKGDYLTGNKWETSAGMLLEFGKDGTFKWFNDKAVRDDNYYSGEFTVMVGQEAVDYLAENHGLAEDIQLSAMDKFDVSIDYYYSVIMNNKERIQGGENNLEEENEIVYYGYYKPKYESLYLYNLDSLTSYDFTKM
ncbi:MAG: hypothetical protein MR503_05400 [Oscillospiraceae bacterium]|nr:hypothetical protein [Oscillospiraceae bacterium]